jgi:hypothetical protein
MEELKIPICRLDDCLNNLFVSLDIFQYNSRMIYQYDTKIISECGYDIIDIITYEREGLIHLLHSNEYKNLIPPQDIDWAFNLYKASTKLMRALQNTNNYEIHLINQYICELKYAMDYKSFKNLINRINVSITELQKNPSIDAKRNVLDLIEGNNGIFKYLENGCHRELNKNQHWRFYLENTSNVLKNIINSENLEFENLESENLVINVPSLNMAINDVRLSLIYNPTIFENSLINLSRSINAVRNSQDVKYILDVLETFKGHEGLYNLIRNHKYVYTNPVQSSEWADRLLNTMYLFENTIFSLICPESITDVLSRVNELSHSMVYIV